MSLINDALRRASQSQKQQPVESQPQLGALLQPVDYQRRPTRWLIFLAVPALAAVLALAGWFFFKAGRSVPHEQAAAAAPMPATPSSTAPASAPSSAPAQIASSTKILPAAPAATRPVTQTNVVTVTNVVFQTNVMAAPAVVAQPTDPPKAPPATASTSDATPNAAPAKPETALEPKPFPALNLQGISYQPPKSFAIINGKKAFVGDRVEDAKIVTIDRQTVTVEFAGQTKMLTIQ